MRLCVRHWKRHNDSILVLRESICVFVCVFVRYFMRHTDTATLSQYKLLKQQKQKLNNEWLGKCKNIYKTNRKRKSDRPTPNSVEHRVNICKCGQLSSIEPLIMWNLSLFFLLLCSRNFFISFSFAVHFLRVRLQFLHHFCTHFSHSCFISLHLILFSSCTLLPHSLQLLTNGPKQLVLFYG